MTDSVKIKTKNVKKKKMASLDKRKARAGWIFVLPFVIGFILIYLPVLVESLSASVTYRMKEDGTQKKAVTDKKAYNMYVYKDKIFYTSPTRDNLVVCSININGKNNKKIKKIC